jgi:hypothetical protein
MSPRMTRSGSMEPHLTFSSQAREIPAVNTRIREWRALTSGAMLAQLH